MIQQVNFPSLWCKPSRKAYRQLRSTPLAALECAETGLTETIEVISHKYLTFFGLSRQQLSGRDSQLLGSRPPAMTASASKLVRTLKLKGAGKADNKALAAGALTARTNLSTESADNELNLEVKHRLSASQSTQSSVCVQQTDRPAEAAESKRSVCKSRRRQRR